MAKPLKNMVDRTVVEDIASRFADVDTGFDADGFVADLMAVLPDLELKPRIEAIARRIASGLDPDYPSALECVAAVATGSPPIEGFAAWPLCTFVEIFGLEHPDESLAAMEHLTKRASCEFAVRPYLRDHFAKAYAVLLEFTDHADEAVRRLPSEGTRPRLPWGANVARLVEDPAPGLALLERLRHDPSETVRRSVANHLNDVAKNEPDLIVETVRRWVGEQPPVDARLAKHALRTLVKQGHPGAMETLGFTTEPSVEIVSFSVAPSDVSMGDHVVLDVELRSSSATSQRLVVDFVIHHVTAAGRTSPKVFKWTTLDLAAGATATLSKRRLIQHASTRTYHPGQHLVELQVAGEVMAKAMFTVRVD